MNNCQVQSNSAQLSSASVVTCNY